MFSWRTTLLFITAVVLSTTLPGRNFVSETYHAIQAAAHSGQNCLHAIASCVAETTHPANPFDFLARSHQATVPARTSRREEETIPWPGPTFLILEKGTSHALSLHPSSDLVVVNHISPLQSPDARNAGSSHWHCVERNGYFGFRNVRSGMYLGHDNGGRVRATAERLQAWEMFTPRRHPDGGYQLLSPHWADGLWVVGVEAGTGNVVREQRGGAVWEFRVV
jgi:hypothetical protein